MLESYDYVVNFVSDCEECGGLIEGVIIKNVPKNDSMIAGDMGNALADAGDFAIRRKSLENAVRDKRWADLNFSYGLGHGCPHCGARQSWDPMDRPEEPKKTAEGKAGNMGCALLLAFFVGGIVALIEYLIQCFAIGNADPSFMFIIWAICIVIGLIIGIKGNKKQDVKAVESYDDRMAAYRKELAVYEEFQQIVRARERHNEPYVDLKSGVLRDHKMNIDNRVQAEYGKKDQASKPPASAATSSIAQEIEQSSLFEQAPKSSMQAEQEPKPDAPKEQEPELSQQELYEIARKSYDFGGKDGEKVMPLITDIDLLDDLASSARHPRVRFVAKERKKELMKERRAEAKLKIADITSQEELANIAEDESQDRILRETAARAVTNRDILMRWALEHEKVTFFVMLDRVNDQDDIIEIARNAKDPMVRAKATEAIEDKAVLVDMARNNWGDRKQALERLSGYVCSSCGQVMLPEGDDVVSCTCCNCGEVNHDWHFVNNVVDYRDYSAGSRWYECSRCHDKKNYETVYTGSL